jgi:hypothetical protein
MNFRPVLAVLAFAAFSAPFAAHADAPSGNLDAILAVDESVKVDPPKFDRSKHRTYVEDILAAPTLASESTVTREQVREELAKMPPVHIGA